MNDAMDANQPLTVDRRGFLRTTFFTALSGAAAGLAYGRFVESQWIEATAREVAIRDLPVEFDGFRIAQLSDIHHGRMMPREMILNGVAICNAAQPDIAVVTGDHLGDHQDYLFELAELLTELRPRIGTFVILGNHDYGVYSPRGTSRDFNVHKKVVRAFGGQRLTLLRNDRVVLERGAASLDLVGLDDFWSRQTQPQVLDEIAESRPRIVLAHNPDTVLQIGQKRADLILSGHTHGGQIVLPMLGPIVVPTEHRRFVAGLYQVGQNQLYVNRGLGFVWRPVRFGARPEVAMLTLRRAESPATT
ncbi:MAG: metallophosphoesterase [Planctomycetota bacterium]